MLDGRGFPVAIAWAWFVTLLETAGALLLAVGVLTTPVALLFAVEVDVLLQRARTDVLPVMNDHAKVARSAFRRFGKGRHPAGLNFGDCFSYTLAMMLGDPLLFVGDDFSRTDVLVALY